MGCLRDELLELRSGEGLVFAAVIIDEKGGLDVVVFGMVVDELEAFVQPHDHKGGGHGVGIPSVATHH